MHLAKTGPGHPDRIWAGFAQYDLGLFRKNWTELDEGSRIQPDFGSMLAVMAITGHNQNASESDLACLLGKAETLKHSILNVCTHTDTSCQMILAHADIHIMCARGRGLLITLGLKPHMTNMQFKNNDKTDRQTDTHTHTHTQTDRHTHRHTHTHTYTHTTTTTTTTHTHKTWWPMMCTRGPAPGAEELPHHTQTKLLGPQQWWGLRHTLACTYAMQWDLRSTKHLPSVQTSNKMATTVKKLFTEKNILHQTSMHWHNERSILEEKKKKKGQK